ncbi:MAG: TlpA family protein disulfide reductase [Gemmatimonadota bacterium]
MRWILPLAAIPFLGLLYFGLARNPDFFPTPLIDEPAPSWHLETLDGDSLALAELRGTVVVLNFWASWCVPCRAEHAVLMRTARTYPEDDVQVVGVVYDDSRRNAQRFLDELGNAWRHVMDPGSRTAIDHGVHGVPETFFLRRDGTIGMKHIGPLTWDVVQTNVDSLLADLSVAAGDQ